MTMSSAAWGAMKSTEFTSAGIDQGFWVAMALTEVAVFITAVAAWTARGVAPDTVACSASADAYIPLVLIMGALKSAAGAGVAAVGVRRRYNRRGTQRWNVAENGAAIMSLVIFIFGIQIVAAMSDSCLIAIGGGAWLAVKMCTWSAVAEVTGALLLHMFCRRAAREGH
jgi:hypothetical protein